MRNVLILWHIFLVAISLPSAYAKTVYYGTEVETVSIVYGQTTLFKFNEEVKTISKASQFVMAAADPIDPNYQILSVRSRGESSTDFVSFILANDAVVNLKIVTVPVHLPEKTDNIYDFIPKDIEIDPLSREEKGTNVTEIELMKGMIRMGEVIGYNSKSLIQTIDSGQQKISAQLVRVYTGPKYNGYVFKVKNNSSSESFAIDLKSLSFGKPSSALLSQTDSKLLAGKEETFLRVVTKPTAVFYDIVLPITTMDKKGDANGET